MSNDNPDIDGPVDFGDKLSDFLMGDERQSKPHPAGGKIKVIRIIEYTYADAETMAADMAKWTIQGPREHIGNKMSFRSASLPPDFISGDE